MTSRRSRKHHSEQEGFSSPAWMTTYADMTQLILCFFIALFAFSQVDTKKFEQVASSFQSVFGGGTGIMNNGQNSILNSQYQSEMQELAETYSDLEAYLEDEQLSGKVELVQEERGIMVSFADQVLFELGKADLGPHSKKLLRDLSAIIKPLPNQLRVEGHTDVLPIQTVLFPSNWELSTARATGVVRYLVEECGLPANKLSAAGYGQWRPRYPNDSPAHRAKNRRVDVVILRSGLSENEPD